ncbi:MBL fold metallo-hydrolase [Gordonibacter sp. An230]|uniref:MBL fold metallo-hydrolase n=1 Tax=Gordonibacter sp. An230 TaxID=1965592 RepID=UPI000B36DB46|nr:MBL fold metallo-hydrolase [Gordonibacter sp. An230]OUO90717.1 MBL fold metallo-hydrolase [Gordonibacter sp. An230]
MSWSKVHSDPDVYEVRVPFQNVSTSATNCFVVMDGGEALVVDTGAPTEEGAAVLDAALDEIGVERSRATFFLTHLHLDHAGLVDRVAPEGATVLVGSADFDAMRASGASAYERMRRLLASEGVSLSDASGYARHSVEMPLFDPARVDVRFAVEGDEVPVGGRRLRVVEVPGHTPGSLALFDPASRILFGGDHVLFVISPGIALFPDGRDGLQAYLDSLEKVRSLGCSRLFVAHGDERADFEARIDWLRAHHLGRLEEAQGIVRSCPGLSGEEVVRSIKWNVPFERWEDISFMQRWCIVMEGLVFLNHLVDRGLVRRDEDEAGVRRYF